MSLTLEGVIDHIRNRSYMSGVQRTQTRVKSTGEVFTPTELVREVLENMDIEKFKDLNRTFLDPACGDGQFLGEVLIRKMENGSTFEQALSTIYGVDLMQDNVDECRKRLLCGSQDSKHIAMVEQNIYQADALKFSYKFKPMSSTRKRREVKLRNRVQKEKLKAQDEARKLEAFNRCMKEEKSKKKITKAINVTELSPATMP